MDKSVRRLAAATAATTLVVLVACDLWIEGFRVWWTRHSLTGSIVSSLLVVAVTALIIDEVVADRQRRERSVSVAVQGLIVYGQTRRTYAAVTADEEVSGAASEELRALASMLLTASSSLFDDPVARRFLAQAERLAGVMIRTVAGPSAGALTPESRARLTSEMTQLQAAVEPLAGARSERGALRARRAVGVVTAQTFTLAMCSSG